MKFPTPLRYPGGKGKLANFVKLVFEQNDLLDGHYIEPYAGGASIALSLLYEEFTSTIHINDLNKAVYSFWFSVLNETEDLCQKIADTPVNMNTWHQQKAIQKDLENNSSLDIGFSTFFLNRANRSGILTAGVIGGKNQNGAWLMDARFNKEDLIYRIKKIARYKSRIKIYNLDAIELIRQVIPALPKKSLVYLDPPYYVKGKDLYQNHYIHEDHANLASIVKNNIAQNWIVSYDSVPQISELYKEFRQIVYELSYSAAIKQKGSELMVFDDELTIPNVTNPAKIKAA